MHLKLSLVQHYSLLFRIMVMIALQQGALSASSRLGTTEVKNSSMAKDSRMSFFAASSGPSDVCVWHDASHTFKRLAFIESATSYSNRLVIHISLLGVR